MPGFKQHFNKYKPAEQPATSQEQELLRRYRPRIFMAKGQTPFLDFYADYIAHGELYSSDKLVSNKVDAALLNQYRDDPDAEFRHITSEGKTTPAVYGRVAYDELKHQGETWPLTFLSYNLVFAHSGLLQGLPTWQQWLVESTGFNIDWHQLDHYVGLTIALYQQRPIAVTLQQHNYQTTYIPGYQGLHGISWPDDQRIQVDVALQSNELYPHSPQKTEHPGVSFTSADNIEFLKTGENKPLMAGFDITHGEQEQEYALKFLPSTDAFYQFKGRLGENRSLPGRDGPPGADYVTLPGLMPWANRLVSGFRPGSVTQEKAKITALFDEENFTIRPEGLDAYRQDFIQAVFSESLN
ncbi:MAG: hypothetical protein ACPG51_18235 [Thiolinea sp.]